MSIALSLAVTNPRHKPIQEDLPQLAERIQAGDAQAMERLIEMTQSACSRLALSILKDPDLSRDALQEAYIVVYQRIGHLRDTQAVKSWLYRIVSHCCHDIVRRRSKEVHLKPETEVKMTPDLADAWNRQEQIRSTFAQLPEIDRTALALRGVASLSYEEMATVLQVPVGTVRSRLAKARQRFLELYKGVQHD